MNNSRKRKVSTVCKQIITFTVLCVVQFRPCWQVWNYRSLGLIGHNVVSNLVTVCPSQSYVHGFLCLTSTKQGVNVTCSRPRRKASRPGLEPGTHWSVVCDAKHCASPPPIYRIIKTNNFQAFLLEESFLLCSYLHVPPFISSDSLAMPFCHQSI